MKKMAIRILILLLCAVMVLGLVMPALATEVNQNEVIGEYDSAFKRIRTVEDLLAMAENPDGNYVLMSDLDMTGVEWKPVDFTGTFDGNGHALLNLNISQLSDATETAYDGNRKPYQCRFAGFFGTLKDAEVMNLKLMGVEGVVETDEPCFMGGIAGYMYNSTITNCTVVGNMELRAHNQIFGLGGVAGYGLGSIDNATVEVVLICVDTDKETLDEQFLGGAYSTGYIDVTDSDITIDGYVSEYGYAHNGGIVGLYMQYPIGEGKRGYIVRNSVNGKITFFECNTDRRAYCDPFAGEVLAVSYNLSENLRHFQRVEKFEYDRELRPCMCEVPDIREYTAGARCDRYGHTETECYGCGFIYKHTYTPLQHTVTQWELKDAPTLKTEGLSEGVCDKCGELQQRKEPVLVPETEPTEETRATEPTQPQPLPEDTAGKDAVQGKINILYLVLGFASVLLIVAAAFVAREFRRKEE